ncbi:hypothetical protein AWC38_SpisGene21769 [Stylophora pistillata]|uniref:Uncharacterized protein n=1 Tax=Stylophora pistillata TaxID=50429 RepID=A0A2B4R8Y4_STYPI|nr:hypothetical protein AWC38_SpisGene21769 [Stylophora pistillata]
MAFKLPYFTKKAMVNKVTDLPQFWNEDLKEIGIVGRVLSKGELEEEDDENIGHETSSVVSVDTRINNLTTRLSPEPTQSNQTLKEIAEELDISEKTGSSIDEELSKIVQSLIKDKLPAEKRQAKVNKYPRPANIMGLRAPRLNPPIRNQVSAQMRTQDSKYQKTQQSLVAAIVAITKVTDSILKNNSGEKECLPCLKDAIALTMNGLHDMNTIQRQAMKNDLHRDDAALCSSSTVE